jgi:hypothetical protein
MPERITPAEEQLIREFAEANPRKSEIVFKLMDEIDRLRRGLVRIATWTIEEDFLDKVDSHVAARYIIRHAQETAQQILDGTENIT